MTALKLSAAPRAASRRRSLSQRLELAAVLSLMGTSAVCAFLTLIHPV